LRFAVRLPLLLPACQCLAEDGKPVFTVYFPCNDALYTDNRDTTTKMSKTVGLHCKSPPYNSNDARYNDRPNWQYVAVEQFAVGGKTRL